MEKQAWKTYGFWILLSEATGALSGWLTREGAKDYTQQIAQPPLSPPSAVFPVVWTLLFALMGIGAARVWLRPASAARRQGLLIFGIQLAFNFFWSILFFNLRNFGLALVWLAALWALILTMILLFHQVDRPAAWLQLPYLVWTGFAAYLNLGVWLLN